MQEQSQALRDRTKAFAVRVILLFRYLPRTVEGQVVGKQLLRSGTSVGANYRSACRARSRAEFASRIGIVVEEADETVYWLELLIATGAIREDKIRDLLAEARELTAIFTASQRTLREK